MENNKVLETKVGIFLVVGIFIIAGLIIYFGRVGEAFQSTYTIAVDFPNASGLKKGAQVYFAGAPVGRVATPPKLIDNGRAVQVNLKIWDGVNIRKDAKIVIASAGMLGDRFVDVQPQGETADFVKDGDQIKGERQTELSEMAERADPVLKNLKQISQKLDQDVLTPETEENIKETIRKLKSSVTRADDLLAQAQQGKGPLAKILNDPKLSKDLTDFISNIKRHGVLFYTDDAAKERKKEENR